MRKFSISSSRSLPVSRRPIAFTFVGLWLLFALVFALAPQPSARADTPDNQYLKAFMIMEQADAHSTKGQTNLAKAKYAEAHTALRNLKQEYPNWNAKVVAYRMNYVAQRIAVLSAPPVAPATETPSAAPTEAKPAALPAGLQIRVLTAGNEPRRMLRFQPEVGRQESMKMTVKTGTRMGGAEAQAAMIKTPAIHFDLGVITKQVTTVGDINYELEIKDVDVTADADTLPGMAETMKAGMAGTKGVTLLSTVAPQGFNRKTEVRVTRGADPQSRASADSIKESFGNTSFVLPEEAIGVGARWEVKQKIKSQGMTIDQTSLFTLESVEGDVLTVKSDLKQQAANQKVSNPMMPQAKVDVTKFTGTGSGTLTIDLSKVMPAQAAMEIQSEILMSAGGGAESPSLKVASETSVRLELQ